MVNLSPGMKWFQAVWATSKQKQQAIFDFDLSHWNSVVGGFLFFGHVLTSNGYTPGI